LADPLVFNPNIGGPIVNVPMGQQNFLVTQPAGFNMGGIGYSGAKLANLPPFEEVGTFGGYKERWSSDGAHEVVRLFKTPWKTRKFFVDQMLGYSYSYVPPPIAGQQPASPSLIRVIPDQVPEVGYQHLYASDIELVEAAGAWTVDSQIFATNDGLPDDILNPVLVAGGGGAPGGPVIGANGRPVPAPMIFYFDNTRGGQSPGGVVTYKVTYRPRMYEVRDEAGMAALPAGNQGELERYVEFERQSSIQGITIPQAPPAGLYFTNGPAGNENKNYGGSLVPQNAAFIYLQTQALTYTWHEVPDEPRDSILSLVGRTNADTFDGARGRQSYPAGTLLCQPPVVKKYRHPNGRYYWRMQVTLLFRQFFNDLLPNTVLGWNALPAADGRFWPVNFFTANPGQNVVMNSGLSIYPPGDFNQLFVPPTPVLYQ
jgi:hypothetical protein